MKKLQSGYTTWGQGTRLLKLGVPKDSADLYWISRTSKEPVLILNDSVFSIWEAAHKRLDNKCAIKPCWSVFRMMEIFNTCSKYKLGWADVKEIEKNTKFKSYAEFMVRSFEISKGYLDFSKLEEE